jgi:hypothetical protein
VAGDKISMQEGAEMATWIAIQTLDISKAGLETYVTFGTSLII